MYDYVFGILKNDRKLYSLQIQSQKVACADIILHPNQGEIVLNSTKS